jgi:hypothetical protein
MVLIFTDNQKPDGQCGAELKKWKKKDYASEATYWKNNYLCFIKMIFAGHLHCHCIQILQMMMNFSIL